MNLIRLTPENLEREHVCCAISNNRDCQVAAKKEWLAARLEEGLVFLKGDVRGKCFIEYLPAEKAWVPVQAENYLYIDCLWVAGQFKGHGYANQLLEACLEDAKRTGKAGVAALSSAKKKPFLSDGDFLRHHGFVTADTTPPYFELLALPFEKNAPLPRFTTRALPPESGLTLYYCHQCPYTAKYVPLLAEAARARGVALNVVRLTAAEEAQRAPSPFTAFSLFYNGEFVTHEILSEAKFLKILDGLGL